MQCVGDCVPLSNYKLYQSVNTQVQVVLKLEPDSYSYVDIYFCYLVLKPKHMIRTTK